MTEIAAIPAQFDKGSLLNFSPAPEMSEIETSPGLTFESTRRVMKSPIPSTAQPRKSNPGPRLATVAGANDLTEEKIGSGSGMVIWVVWVLEGTAERLNPEENRVLME